MFYNLASIFAILNSQGINLIKAKGMLFVLIIANMLGISAVKAESVNLIAGLPKAPFIIEENGSGLQLDIIRAALAHQKVEVTFTHVPLARGITSFQSLNAGGFITLPIDYSYPNIYMSTPYISYQNVAISLTESGFDITKIADLSGKSISAFQKAKKYLGGEYSRVMSYSLDYREVAEQSQQIEMLFMRQAEVIILDLDIFKYFLQVNQDPLYTKAYTVHPIFDTKPYSIGFRSEKLRDEFNLGLQLLVDQGEYQRIVDKYLE